MLAVLEKASQQGFNLVQLSVQIHLVQFYQSLGFSAVGQTHWEVGIEHQTMHRFLQSSHLRE